jgi:hypothetical protein
MGKCNTFVSKTEAMRLLGKPRRERYYGIKINLTEIRFIGVGWIQPPLRAQ